MKKSTKYGMYSVLLVAAGFLCVAIYAYNTIMFIGAGMLLLGGYYAGMGQEKWVQEEIEAARLRRENE